MNKPLNQKATKISINNNHTFTQYQNDYNSLLETYIKNYIDNTESTFIKEQIWSYKQYLSFQENGTMTNAKRQMLTDGLEHTKTVEELRQSTLQIIEFLKSKWKNLKRELQKTEPEASKQSKQTYIPKPCFKPELIESITKKLNTFFDTSQHAELKRIIETGNNANEKLLFRDNGNRLSDFLKEKYERDVITGCAKTDLINWIMENFKYIYRGDEKEYKFETVEKIISSKERLCKNPII